MTNTVLVFRLIAVFSACLILQSDHCRFVPRLLQLVSNNIDVPRGLYQSVIKGNRLALEQLSQYAATTEDQHWLEVAAQLGVVDSFYQLAILQSDQALHLKYLRLAAIAEHPKSQFELFLADDRSTQKLFWLKKAALNQYQPAILALYHWYKLRGMDQQAQPLLQQAALFNSASAHILGRQLWRDGEQHQAIETFQLASQLGSKQAEVYLNHIAWFRPPSNFDANSSKTKPSAIERQGCVTRLQFVAASIEGAVKSSDLIRQFSEDQRLSNLPLCINQPIWAKHSDLSCSSNKKSGGRLSCDLSQLSEIVNDHNFSHLVVIGDSGKANVHNGIMYLDLADDYSVFVHELAHFAGFVDEYPLSSVLAENICSGNNKPNLLFIAPDSKLNGMPMEDFLSSIDSTLIKARTCANHPNQAYKTSGKITFMEFHDYGLIPDNYLANWRELLMDRKSQFPAALNFSQYFSANKSPEQHNLWAERLANFYLPNRKKVAVVKTLEPLNQH